MKVLIVAPRYPYPLLRGDQRRVHRLASALSRHADVRVLAFGSGPDLADTGAEITGVPASQADRLLANLAAPDPRLPAQTRLFLSRQMRRAVRREVEAWRPDVVDVTLARMGPYAAGLDVAHVHLDLIDSLARNMRTRAAASGMALRWLLRAEARLMGAYEARLVRSVDSASVVAGADTHEPGLGGARVVPMGVDLDEMVFADPADRPPRLLFFGNLGYFHNAEPARVAAEQVLPMVRETVPDAELHIVGARPSGSVQRLDRLPNVTVVGPVDRMADELHGAAVAVLPSYTGSGMKNKVLEALAAGTPVVANRLGVDGIEGMRAGVHYAEGEEPRDLARAAVGLLQSPKERSAMAADGLAHVTEHFSWDAQARALLGLWGHPVHGDG